MARDADWKALNALALDYNQWNPVLLEQCYQLLASSLKKSLPYLSVMAKHVWEADVGMLKSIYGDIDSQSHFFCVERLDWGFNIKEPQMTKGWEHFLSMENGKGSKNDRAIKFLQSISELSKTPFFNPEEFENTEIAIKSEKHLEHKGKNVFVDLFLQWKPAGEPTRLVAIEFKIGHNTTDEQLEKIESYLGHYKSNSQPAYFFLIAPGIEKYCNALDNNPVWNFISWTDLLCRYQQNFQPTASPDFDVEFQRFLRTVLYLATGV